jgi:hypothetical protein
MEQVAPMPIWQCAIEAWLIEGQDPSKEHQTHLHKPKSSINSNTKMLGRRIPRKALQSHAEFSSQSLCSATDGAV